MIKLTFELIPEDGYVKPYNHPFGYVFRGVIMKWLSESKPELVHILHDYEKVRQYAINTIIRKRPPKIDFILVSYDDLLSETLVKDIITDNKISLQIGNKQYYISKVQFEKIIVRNFCSAAQPVKAFNIKFITPAYFNTLMGDYPVRFPIPSLLFGNLANLWNSITEDEGEINRDTFINWINAHVYVSYYKMKTVRRDINKPKPVYGGKGDAAFRVKKANKNYYSHYLKELGRGEEDSDFLKKDYINNCKWLDALCHFGQYTNVGANRTAGMGVIRYYPKYYLKER